MEEIFKPIPDFDGYEISNYGRVISYKNKVPKELTISKYSTISIFNDGVVAIIATNKDNKEVGVIELTIKNGKIVSTKNMFVEENIYN